jgi:hypothetical protein
MLPETTVEAVPDIDLALKMLGCSDFACTVVCLNGLEQGDKADSQAMCTLRAQQPLILLSGSELRDANLSALIEDAVTQFARRNPRIQEISSTVRSDNPELFARLVAEYTSLMDVSLDQRAFRITASASAKLSEVSKTLGDARAGPRDIIELFATALKAKSKNVPNAKAKAYSDIALLMALELMGYLVSYYRNLIFKKAPQLQIHHEETADD